ncbi:MAG TPA: cupin-like domain-containing protein [Aquabacterium sp.]|nr:cupin-like domain-containing protein [Aquabacterium sp.]
MTRCFNEQFRPELMDRQSFKFGHTLLDHPALTLASLSEVIPALPASQVMYSKGLLDTGADFEGTFKKRPQDATIEEVIDQIRTRDSYIMVRQPEKHAVFADLHKALIGEVASVLRQRGVRPHVIDPQLYLFIASPNSITPFHIDRYSTFLMQFRGTKQVCVHPQWDQRVVSAPNAEAYVAYQSTKLPWSPEVDKLGITWDFSPGEALHIPFLAGHHVKNGPDDVSISMSIIFNTDESMMWRRAYRFNHAVRGRLARFGIEPHPVGDRPWLDASKSGLVRLRDKLADLRK